MIVINNQEEMQKYYDEERNTYKFNSNVKFNCDIDVKANIFAQNIKANNIKAYDITALDIKSGDITARALRVCGDIKSGDIIADSIIASEISFYSLCYCFITFICLRIKGRSEYSKYFCLGGDVVIESQNS